MYDYGAAGGINMPHWSVIGTSLLAYLVFKSFEPQQPEGQAALLFGVPLVLCIYLYQTTLRLWLGLGLACGEYWLWLIIFTMLYRLSPFHPLASYPGPAAAKITKMWMAYKVIPGKVHLYVKDLHQRYGDIVRIGPNELSIRHVDAIFPIYSAKGLRKGPCYSGRVQANGTTALINISDPAEHAARRRNWNRGMNSAALKGYEAIIREQSQSLLSRLVQRQNEKVDLSEWMSYFGFDFMGRMAFGMDFGMLKAGYDVGGVWHIIDKSALAFAVIANVPWLGRWLLKLPQKSSAIGVLRKIAAEKITKRIEQGSQHRDLFHYIIDEDAFEGNKPPIPVVMSDGALAIFAGADTASTALSHHWYFMLRHPKTYARLRQEIDNEFPRGSDPMDFAKHADMPYLNAFINESLRLLPPVLGGLQRSTYERETTSLGPFVVPSHTAVSVPIYSMHRDPRCFSPLPDEFWPERWLTQDSYELPNGQMIPSSRLVHNRDAFFPFSFGPANCAGKNLAFMELRAITVAFVQKFDVGVAEGYDLKRWEEDVRDYGVTTRGSLFVKLTTRF